jgi:REP element-mobilizing transposase RayT
MILAVHAIFGAYGFWLPNDPRGSWSTFVASWELYKFGPATTVSTDRSLAYRPHNKKLRQKAKEALNGPPVLFTGIQARAIRRGFAQAIQDGGFVLHACSVLPDHVHVVIARHARDARDNITHLKSAATRQLRSERLHPFDKTGSPDDKLRSPWARRGWIVYLNSPKDVNRAIKYVIDNPSKENKPRQDWPFVAPYPDRVIPRTPLPR